MRRQLLRGLLAVGLTVMMAWLCTAAAFVNVFGAVHQPETAQGWPAPVDRNWPSPTHRGVRQQVGFKFIFTESRAFEPADIRAGEMRTAMNQLYLHAGLPLRCLESDKAGECFYERDANDRLLMTNRSDWTFRSGLWARTPVGDMAFPLVPTFPEFVINVAFWFLVLQVPWRRLLRREWPRRSHQASRWRRGAAPPR